MNRHGLGFFTEMVKLAWGLFVAGVAGTGYLAGPTPIGLLEDWRRAMVFGAVAFTILAAAGGLLFFIEALLALREMRKGPHA
jgi:hypothetical protein